MALLNERRRHVYPRLLLALLAFWSVAGYIGFSTHEARKGGHYGSDFIVYWSAASLAKRGEAPRAYELASLHAEEQSVAPNIEQFPWHYPPPFLAMLLPLAFLPYAFALAVWEVLTGGLFALVMRRVVSRRRWVGISLAAIPALITALFFGQNGFLTAALLGGGLLVLPNRPVLAGGLLGIIAYKPHLAPLVFIALLAGRRWRALAAAVTSAALLAVCSLAVLGWDTWHKFWTDLPTAARVLDEPGAWEKLPTVHAAILLAGGSPIVARVAQSLVALTVAATIAWLWRSDTTPRLRNAALALGILLASPYAFLYDMPVAVLGLAWLFRDAEERPWLFWERVTAGLAAILPLLVWPLAAQTGVQVGPLFLGLLFVAVVRRALLHPVIGASVKGLLKTDGSLAFGKTAFR